MKEETRFFNRKAHLISFGCFMMVMQELLKDVSLKIVEDYPTLSIYSRIYDRYYEEDEIIELVENYLGVTIAAHVKSNDLREIYFVEDK